MEGQCDLINEVLREVEVTIIRHKRKITSHLAYQLIGLRNILKKLTKFDVFVGWKRFETEMRRAGESTSGEYIIILVNKIFSELDNSRILRNTTESRKLQLYKLTMLYTA